LLEIAAANLAARLDFLSCSRPVLSGDDGKHADMIVDSDV